LTRPVGDLAQLTNRAAPGRWRLAVRGSGATVPAATPSDRGPVVVRAGWPGERRLWGRPCAVGRSRSSQAPGHGRTYDLFVDDPPEFSTWSPAWTSWPSA